MPWAKAQGRVGPWTDRGGLTQGEAVDWPQASLIHIYDTECPAPARLVVDFFLCVCRLLMLLTIDYRILYVCHLRIFLSQLVWHLWYVMMLYHHLTQAQYVDTHALLIFHGFIDGACYSCSMILYMSLAGTVAGVSSIVQRVVSWV